MDAYRKHGKHLMAQSAKNSRAARIEWRRQLQLQKRKAVHARPHPAGTQAPPPPLRRYSDLNLGGSPSSTKATGSREARPATSDGTTRRSRPMGHSLRSKAQFSFGMSGNRKGGTGIKVERGCIACCDRTSASGRTSRPPPTGTTTVVTVNTFADSSGGMDR